MPRLAVSRLDLHCLYKPRSDELRIIKCICIDQATGSLNATLLMTHFKNKC